MKKYYIMSKQQSSKLKVAYVTMLPQSMGNIVIGDQS